MVTWWWPEPSPGSHAQIGPCYMKLLIYSGCGDLPAELVQGRNTRKTRKRTEVEGVDSDGDPTSEALRSGDCRDTVRSGVCGCVMYSVVCLVGDFEPQQTGQE